MADQFIGEIRLLPYSFNPDEWVPCNGQELSISQYSVLYSVIGNMYGGDGRVSFRVPDLRGRAPMQAGQGPGLSQHTLGESWGFSSIALDEVSIPAHAHDVNFTLAVGQTEIPGPTVRPGVDDSNDLMVYRQDLTNLQPMNAQTVGVSGESAPHLNLQPCMSLQFCVAYSGEYPPRS